MEFFLLQGETIDQIVDKDFVGHSVSKLRLRFPNFTRCQNENYLLDKSHSFSSFVYEFQMNSISLN